MDKATHFKFCGLIHCRKMKFNFKRGVTWYDFTITDCAVAQHCYKGDVSFLWEKWNLWPPVKSKPLNRLTDNSSWLTTSTRKTLVPNLVKNLFTVDFWAKGWNVTFCVTFYFFFWDQGREETPGRILTRDGSKDAESRRDVPF